MRGVILLLHHVGLLLHLALSLALPLAIHLSTLLVGLLGLGLALSLLWI